MPQQPEKDYKLMYERLCKKVIATLDVQKEYFRYKNYDLLKKAKAMETELRKMASPPPPPKQTDLFFNEFLSR